MEVRVGDRVRLGPVPDDPDNPAREEGLVISRDVMSWGISIVVRVSDQYREGDYDDGFRECTEDQIEAVIKPKK